MKEEIIDIIGAGIGGLSTAIALRQKGFNVRIFEQSQTLSSVGAGIILASNAMQIYDKLGLREEIEKKGKIISSMQITKQTLEPISTMDLTYLKSLYNVNTVAIHRADLQKILIGALEGVEIHLGYKLVNIKHHSINNILEFANGVFEKSLVLIGADGLHSSVRKISFSPSTLREAKQVCWRGVTNYKLSDSYEDSLYEAWGDTARFGFVKISDTQVYWYALKSFMKSAKECNLDKIDTYFEAFHPMIRDMIASTSKNDIHSAEIMDLKPLKTWHQNTICLLGDAAHAMTPNMGQGACQAIEDAYVISEYLSVYPTQEAFAKYHKNRYSKVANIVKMSWTMGKVSHIQNPLLMKLRNFALSSMPVWLSRKQSEGIFTLQIPTEANIENKRSV